ncbi:MAG: hypothetical protein JNL01_06710 [Bdellovibrionales bacterium]|nr:hypothetical protein [Bdellovibrionales bacterium]
MLFSVLIYALSIHSAKASLDPVMVNSAIDVLSYEFQIDATNYEKGLVPIQEKIQLRLQASASSVEFHGNSKSIQIEQITQGSKVLTFQWASDGKSIQVQLPQVLSAGQSTTIQVQYKVKPVTKVTEKKGGMVRTKTSSGTTILNTASWPYFSRNWAIVNDHPTDPAQVSFEISTAPGILAFANGTAAFPKSGVTRWQQKQPIPTYGMAFMVGAFQTYFVKGSRVPVALIWDPAYASPYGFTIPQYKTQLKKVALAMDFFSKIFSAFPNDKLYFGIVPQAFNMEATSLVAAVDSEALVHELVHHWWGNWVRIQNWNDLWISEGLTTYFTGYYDEVTDGKNTSCFQAKGTLRSKASRLDPLSVFDDTPYCMGASAVQDLRERIADLSGQSLGTTTERATFEKVMGRIFRDLKDRAVDSNEFARVAQEIGIAVLGTAKTVDVSNEIKAWKKKWID